MPPPWGRLSVIVPQLDCSKTFCANECCCAINIDHRARLALITPHRPIALLAGRLDRFLPDHSIARRLVNLLRAGTCLLRFQPNFPRTPPTGVPRVGEIRRPSLVLPGWRRKPHRVAAQRWPKVNHSEAADGVVGITLPATDPEGIRISLVASNGRLQDR